MTIVEQIFQADTELEKLSKAICALSLIKQHLTYSKIYIPERFDRCLNDCIASLISAELGIQTEMGKRLSTILNCEVIDDEILQAFLPPKKIDEPT